MADKFQIAGKKFDIGKTLNLGNIKEIAEKTGVDVSKIREKAKAQDFGIGAGAKSYSIPKPTEAPKAPPEYPYSITPGGGLNNQPGMTREQASDYVFQSGLLTLQGNINTELEKLRGVSASSVASIGAGATVRSAELDNEARKYLADKDYLGKTDVAKIQAENNLRLQDIINAGLKDVEGVRQQGGRDIARITGEFGVKQEAEKQRGQKDIANIGAQAGYRNALIGAFSF